MDEGNDHNPGSWDWVKFKEPWKIWEEHPTYLLYEYQFYICAFLALLHAIKSGGRYPYFWLTTLLHGFAVELLSYNFPTIDCFWHSQGTFTFLNGRLPSQVLFIHPFFLYTAFAAISQLKLNKWIEPWAVGIATMMIDIPYDIMGVKLVWWTWHDTDPNIFDRMYWVPWTSYFFHVTFAASVTILFNSFRWFILGKGRYDTQSGGIHKELLVCVLTGLFGMPGGVLQFSALYHPIHDIFQIHSEVCDVCLFAVLLVILWTVQKRRPLESQQKGAHGKSGTHFLGLALAIHYIFYILLSIFSKPENVISIGFHEKTGPCDIFDEVQSPIGQVRYKGRYLCTSNYDEQYFDFHCAKDQKPPNDGTSWYKICGTPFENRAEYIFSIITIGFVCLAIFYNILYGSVHLKQIPSKKKNH